MSKMTSEPRQNDHTVSKTPVGVFKTGPRLFKTGVGVFKTGVGVFKTGVGVFKTGVGVFKTPGTRGSRGVGEVGLLEWHWTLQVHHTHRGACSVLLNE